MESEEEDLLARGSDVDAGGGERQRERERPSLSVQGMGWCMVAIALPTGGLPWRVGMMTRRRGPQAPQTHTQTHLGMMILKIALSWRRNSLLTPTFLMLCCCWEAAGPGLGTPRLAFEEAGSSVAVLSAGPLALEESLVPPSMTPLFDDDDDETNSCLCFEKVEAFVGLMRTRLILPLESGTRSSLEPSGRGT